MAFMPPRMCSLVHAAELSVLTALWRSVRQAASLLGTIPTGLQPSAQGCESDELPWVKDVKCFNPNGVASFVANGALAALNVPIPR